MYERKKICKKKKLFITQSIPRKKKVKRAFNIVKLALPSQSAIKGKLRDSMCLLGIVGLILVTVHGFWN